ncbi:hypothetical protein ABT324_00665 [Saccharopolyspora sp. NPDC000359]|uniref:hypothetical protein n=1 Tax=Saccharopolyspora sp. NPDC000359 TaxID=3154251 RepID=UPI003323825F
MKLRRGRNIRPRPEFRKAVDDEAYAAGVDRGWDAANYAEAYGGNPMDGIGAHSYSGPDFEAGYREGIDRFQRSQWADGTSREES